MEMNPTWYTSIAGIIIATGIIVQVCKKLLGNVAGFMAVPTWIYSALVATALTFASRYFGYLKDEGTLLELLMAAALAAASASGFWSWFSSPTAIGQSHTAQMDRAKDSQGFARLPVLFLLTALAFVPLVVAGCALKNPQRKVAVVSMVGLHAALAALDDTERILFDAKAQCGSSVCVSDAEHQEFSAKLVPVLKSAREATVTVRQWPVNEPAPPEVRTLVEQSGKLALEALGIFKSPEAQAKLAPKLLAIQAAAIAILSILPLAGA